jgi:hypothetical protein
MTKPDPKPTSTAQVGKPNLLPADQLSSSMKDILQIFRDELGKDWRDPPFESAVTARAWNALASIDTLLRIARAGIDAFMLDDPARKTIKAMKTLLLTLPQFIANAEAAAEKGRLSGLPSQGDWFAVQGNALLRALEPWRQPLTIPKRADQRRLWHWYVQMLALDDVPTIIKYGTGKERISLTNPDSAAIKIIKNLLASVGIFHEADAIVKILKG